MSDDVIPFLPAFLVLKVLSYDRYYIPNITILFLFKCYLPVFCVCTTQQGLVRAGFSSDTACFACTNSTILKAKKRTHKENNDLYEIFCYFRCEVTPEPESTSI